MRSMRYNQQTGEKTNLDRKTERLRKVFLKSSRNEFQADDGPA